MSSKKAEQLGMNPSTASGRLVKDLLFASIQEKNYCYHCGEPMSREDFSIEHMKPWLDSDDPVKNFFDLNNIAFSHLKCNVGAARNKTSPYSDEERLAMSRARKLRYWTKERRREAYLKTGK